MFNFHTSGLNKKEIIKRAYKRFFVSLFFAVAVLSSLGYAAVNSRFLEPEKGSDVVAVTGDVNKEPETLPAAAPSGEVKKEVTKNPPKSGSVKGRVTTNQDGSKTGTVAEGGAVAGALSSASGNNGSSSPMGVPYFDQVGSYAGLESVLKNYLNSNLRWHGEISQLRGIYIQNAGASGWAGQWGGTYYMNQGGDITSAYGVIVLNVYYYKDSPYFIDYMKLVLSHEYGHHYTMYHKWVEGDLPIDVRFPDSYYSVRPLPKSGTSTDCSANWYTCDPEIIAEDYSYIYSGYGYHAMVGNFGYPSNPGTKSWLDNIETTIKSSAPVSNNPPSVSLTVPLNGATLSGGVLLAADAGDDIGLSKVRFIIDSSTIADDTSEPYSFSYNTEAVSNGTHTIKAVAYDTGGLTAESAVTVTINNAAPTPPSPDTEAPTVSFSAPAISPYAWTSGDLIISVTSNDNVGLARVDLYINDSLALTVNDDRFSARWDYNSAPAGEYTLVAKAYDAAGNFGTAALVVNKN